MPILALLLQAAPVSRPPVSPPPAAPWTPVVSDDPASGRHSISASVMTADGAARLVVRCDKVTEGVVSVQFVPHQPLLGRGMQPVALQFDGATAMIDNFELMGAGAIERVDVAVTTLVSGIAHARAITVHTANRAGDTITYTFAGPPSDAPLRRVLAGCGYELGQVPPRGAAPAPTPTATPTPAATPARARRRR